MRQKKQTQLILPNYKKSKPSVYHSYTTNKPNWPRINYNWVYLSYFKYSRFEEI